MRLLVLPFFLLTACGGADFSATASLGADEPDAIPGLRPPSGTGGSLARIDSKGGTPSKTDSGVSAGGSPSAGGSGGTASGGAAVGTGGVALGTGGVAVASGGSPSGTGGVASTGGVVGTGGAYVYGLDQLLVNRPDCKRGGIFPHPCSANVPGNVWVLCATETPLQVSWCTQNATMSTTSGWDSCCVPP